MKPVPYLPWTDLICNKDMVYSTDRYIIYNLFVDQCQAKAWKVPMAEGESVIFGVLAGDQFDGASCLVIVCFRCTGTLPVTQDDSD